VVFVVVAVAVVVVGIVAVVVSAIVTGLAIEVELVGPSAFFAVEPGFEQAVINPIAMTLSERTMLRTDLDIRGGYRSRCL
jgi:hypothetical protein